MPTLPTNPKDERLFLKGIKNHAAFRKQLADLSISSDFALFDQKVVDVVNCWYTLAKEHLTEARTALASRSARSVYSRSYYAAYNASKAIRYIVYGEVSLRGDDHTKAASELPDDFPGVDKWASIIATLYEHRLRADYDNWTDTSGEHTFSPRDCIDHAEHFVNDCALYAKSKFGQSL